MTTTLKGDQVGYCMALQTREQHIRREKATSNICTNEALCAVASAAYLALQGLNGLKDLGETIIKRTQYAIRKLNQIEGIKTPVFKSQHFKEFTVNFDKTRQKVKSIHQALLKQHQIHGGKDLSQEFRELGQTALYCVTETHSKDTIDRLAHGLKNILERKR